MTSLITVTVRNIIFCFLKIVILTEKQKSLFTHYTLMFSHSLIEQTIFILILYNYISYYKKLLLAFIKFYHHIKI